MRLRLSPAHDGPALSVVYYIPTDDDELLVSTMAGRGKAHAVARNPKVSLCVLDERWPFAYLQVYAEATVDRDPQLVVDVMMAVGGRGSVGPAARRGRPSRRRGHGRRRASRRRPLPPLCDVRPAPTAPAPERPGRSHHPLGLRGRCLGCPRPHIGPLAGDWRGGYLQQRAGARRTFRRPTARSRRPTWPAADPPTLALSEGQGRDTPNDGPSVDPEGGEAHGSKWHAPADPSPLTRPPADLHNQSCDESSVLSGAPIPAGTDLTPIHQLHERQGCHAQVTQHLPDPSGPARRRPSASWRSRGRGSPSWPWSSCSPSTRSSAPAWRPCGPSAATPPVPSSATCCSDWSTSAPVWSPWPGRGRPPWCWCWSSPAGPIVTGLVEIYAAFEAGEEAGTRAMFILGGPGVDGLRRSSSSPAPAWAPSPSPCCSACST